VAIVATVLSHWSEPENAEGSLMRARMAAAIGAEAELTGVVINHLTATVDVVVRLPDGLIERERDIRIAWVRATLADLVADVFAADELVLGHVLMVEADQSPPSSPIQPRRGDDGP
jgi:hypothetical protein